MKTSLDRIKIATPCPITWEQMAGNERVRFCQHCQLNVYNISALSKPEAEALVFKAAGRVCARLYRRSDGTVMTQDCPVGLRAVRMKISRAAAAVLAIIGSLAPVAFAQEKSRKKDSCVSQTRITQKDIVSSTQDAILTGQVLDPQGAVVVGAAVTVEHSPSKKILKTRSGAEGRFQFIGLRAGKYLVKISSPGFVKSWIEDLEIKNNQATTVDVILFVDQEEVLVGVVGIGPPENDPPGTKTITRRMFESLPH